MFNIGIELPEVKESAIRWTEGYDSGVRGLVAAPYSTSMIGSLFNQLNNPGAEYLTVDLGAGHDWLTSRVYLFAALTELSRPLKCFVFLDTRGTVEEHFLGIARPEKVRSALARRYLWLEDTFTSSFFDLRGISRLDDLMTVENAMTLAGEFLKKIQRDSPPEAGNNEWESLPSEPSLWERAKWLDTRRFKEDLGDAVQTSWFAASPETTGEARNRAILRRDGEFVALVDRDGALKSIVDRSDLLNRFGKEFARPEASSSD